ncbi:MAG: chemotaxis protein CheW [Chthoniobacteraceae bacterium]
MDTDTDQERITEAERAILKQRAREIAIEPERETEMADAIEVIEFGLSGERFAFELRHVREVCSLREITPVPCTPDFIVGVVNLRGEILTVIDLRKFFAMPGKGITQLNQIVLIEDSRTRMGILVDAIHRARSVLLDGLQTALPTLTDVRADYLRGITGDRLVVLDAARLLADPRILVEDRDEA